MRRRVGSFPKTYAGKATDAAIDFRNLGGILTTKNPAAHRSGALKALAFDIRHQAGR
jgi:hypothetical protein